MDGASMNTAAPIAKVANHSFPWPLRMLSNLLELGSCISEGGEHTCDVKIFPRVVVDILCCLEARCYHVNWLFAIFYFNA